MTKTHAMRLLASTSAATALTATALVGLAPVASADAVTVTTYAGLRDAVTAPCVADRVITVGADLIGTDDVLVAQCTVTVDLDGYAVRLRTLDLGAGTTVTLTDGSRAGVRSTFTAAGRAQCGICTTGGELVVSGHVDVVATGGGGAGIGGAASDAAGTLTVAGGAQVTAIGGGGAAGIGGGNEASGGAVTVSGQAVVTATGAGGGAGIGGGSNANGGSLRASDDAVVTATGGPDGGAGLGGGQGGNGGRTTAEDDALVTATGGAGGAGIGGGGVRGGGGDGGPTLATGTADIVATGGDAAAGIGGGSGVSFAGDGSSTSASDDATITATGGDEGGAGIGGGAGILTPGVGHGAGGAGGRTTVSIRASVTAVGGDGGAGIGGGGGDRFLGPGGGGDTTITDDTEVSASTTGGGAAIGGGARLSGELVAGQGSGGTTTVDGDSGLARVTVRAGDGGSAVGPSAGATGFGSLAIDDGVLDVVSGELRVTRDPGLDPEVVIREGGVIETREAVPGSALPGTGALRSGGTDEAAGRIVNGGAITLPTSTVDEALEIADHDYLVAFDANAADATPAFGTPDATAPVEVFAASFEAGDREFPGDPTRPGFIFRGWNTAPDGSGEAITASGELPGASDGTGPIPVTAYAQWRRAGSAADPVVVTTYDELRDAVAAPCTEVYVRVDADIIRPGDTLTTGCDATIDLNGEQVALQSVTVADASTLDVTDRTTGDETAPGQLQLEATTGDAGIEITDAALVVSGRAQATVRGGTGAAGIGGASGLLGPDPDGGSVTVRDDAYVSATGGTAGAGIGGGAQGDGGETTVEDSGSVEARGGTGAAGVGGGTDGGNGGSTFVVDAGILGASGGTSGAGIGGGSGGAGGTLDVAGTALVGAGGGAGGAGIGGGNGGAGGSTTVSDDSTVTAAGGPTGGAGIGGGANGGAGGPVLLDGDGANGLVRVTASGGGSGSAVGAGSDSTEFGSLIIRHAVLNVLTGQLRLARGPFAEPEMTVGAGGLVLSEPIDVDQVPTGGDGELVSDGVGEQAGRIDNGGAILLPADAVDAALVISDHDYLVTFDANADDASLADGTPDADEPVEVFASSFLNGERESPADPTRPGYDFTGWNTAADGTGRAVTSDSELPGASDGTGPVAITAYAQWEQDELLPAVTATITGQPKVGQTLTARASLASPVGGVTYTYQWLRDGEPIRRATGRTYTAVRADIARAISVRVVAAKPERTASRDTSTAVGVRPVIGIEGVLRVGRMLTARVFVPEGARASYRWQMAERPRRGEQREFRQVGTGPTYTLKARDVEQRVRLVVTIAGRGYTEVTAYRGGKYVKP